MEHREHPRMTMSEAPLREGSDPAASRRFARFVPAPSVRRLAVSRIGLAVLASIALLAIVALVFSQGLYSAAAWLHRQPVYAVQSITLDPPPPAWFRGGQERFIARVGLDRAKGEPASVLDIDLKQLAQRFRLFAWVKKVKRVRRSYPNRLTIELDYRSPVAGVPLAKPPAPRAAIDEEGVLLPIDDIDPSTIDALIVLSWPGAAPADRTPGKVWSRYDGGEGVTTPDERVLAAARLAAFLKTAQEREPVGPAALRFESVFLKTDDRGLFAQTTGELWVWVCWGDPPGFEAPGTLNAEAKWSLLRDWVRKNDVSEISKNDYLEFSKGAVKKHLGR